MIIHPWVSDTKCGSVSVPPELRELIPGFVKRNQEFLSDLGEATEHEDYKTLELIAQDLGESAEEIGAIRLLHLAELLETAAHKSAQADIKILLDEIDRFLATVALVKAH